MLGPGLLESAYKECLYYELTHSNIFVEKEKALPLIYKDVKLECGYRIDLMVEETVVIEIKGISKNSILTFSNWRRTKVEVEKEGFLEMLLSQ